MVHQPVGERCWKGRLEGVAERGGRLGVDGRLRKGRRLGGTGG